MWPPCNSLAVPIVIFHAAEPGDTEKFKVQVMREGNTMSVAADIRLHAYVIDGCVYKCTRIDILHYTILVSL